MQIDEQEKSNPELERQSKVEQIKAASKHLRGYIGAELEEATPSFTEDSATLLKFHGIYQQDDPDRRKEALRELRTRAFDGLAPVGSAHRL